MPDRQHLPRSRIAQLYAPQALSAWNNAARDHTGCHRALRANGTRRAFGTYRTHGSRRTHRAFGANRGFGTYRTDRARRAFRNRWALGAYRSGRAFRTNRRRGADRTCRARRTFRLSGRFHASSDQPYAAAKRIPMQFKPAALLHPKPGQRRVALDASARGVGVPHRVGRKYASVDNRWKGQPYAFRVHQHKKGFRLKPFPAPQRRGNAHLVAAVNTYDIDAARGNVKGKVARYRASGGPCKVKHVLRRVCTGKNVAVFTRRGFAVRGHPGERALPFVKACARVREKSGNVRVHARRGNAPWHVVAGNYIA